MQPNESKPPKKTNTIEIVMIIAFALLVFVVIAAVVYVFTCFPNICR